ncbi:hypothetical protein KKH27_08610 [bacterium]|nr:hypothetical protein [bacterium]MBU1983384.1 hypothetical protein [bacterium]
MTCEIRLHRTLLFLLLIVSMADGQDRLYVVQYGDESLAEIRLETGAVNPHVLDLGYGCNDIIAHGSRLFVTNSLLNTVQEIDAETDVTLRDIPTTGGVNPHSAATLNSDTLAVTNWISNNVLLIRLSSGQVVGNVYVGVAPQGIVAHGDRVYVCLTRYLPSGQYGPGVVMIYNRGDFHLLDSLRVGMNPQTAAVDEWDRLHVVCTGNYGTVGGEIHVVDLGNRQTEAVVEVGGSPSNISFGGGQALLAAGGWGDHGEVYRYRLDDLTVLNDQASPIRVGSGATDVEALADGSFFVSCAMTDEVEHRSNAGALFNRYPVSDGPGQMVLYGGESPIQPVVPRLVARESAIREAYPNPSNGSVRFRLSASLTEPSIILIYNSIGQIVARLPVGTGRQEVGWQWDRDRVNPLATGTYYAILDDGRGGRAYPIVLMK